MKTFKFADILSSLQNLDPWLEGLGIRVNQDRIHRAIQVVQDAHNGWKTLRETGKPSRIGNANEYYFGLVEALEFRDIYTAFKDDDPEILGPKLERALSGPFRPAEETKETSDGRNMMFELALAADLRLRGGNIAVGEPDICLKVSDRRFLIECKRPFGEGGVVGNVRRVATQLKPHLRSDSRAVGVIAVSATRILNQGAKLFLAPTAHDYKRLTDELEKLAHKREQDWRKGGIRAKIAGVLFHVQTPAVIKDQNLLVMMTSTCLLPTGQETKEFAVLANEYQSLFSAQMRVENRRS